jgi:hypothetical protein
MEVSEANGRLLFGLAIREIIRIFIMQIIRIMTTKLTLSLDIKVIRKAKRYAKDSGRSVSELVENYFRSLTGPEDNRTEDLTTSVKSLMGSFIAPTNLDYKKVLKEEKRRRHG